MFIRQIALVARDLEPVVSDLRAILGLEVPFRDPGVAEFGLHNAVMPIGDTFLEVVSPVRADASAARFLERRGGDGGYMVILQTGDLAGDRRRLDALGVRVVWEIAFDDIATAHLHPRDVGAAIVSIDQPRPPESWRWAGPGWEERARREVVDRIEGVEIQCADPASVSAVWSRILDAPVRRGDLGEEIALDRGRIAFTVPGDDRGDGIAALHLRARAPDHARDAARRLGRLGDGGAIRVGGIRIVLV